jgi:hypothetical protein
MRSWPPAGASWASRHRKARTNVSAIWLMPQLRGTTRPRRETNVGPLTTPLDDKRRPRHPPLAHTNLPAIVLAHG